MNFDIKKITAAKRSRRIFVLGAVFLAFFCFVSFNTVFAEDGVQKALDGLKDSAEKGYGTNDLSSVGVGRTVPQLIGQVVGTALSFIGILFLLLMIYAGILWMTARGNDQQVAKAQELIYAAVIGLVIVLSAYAITAYVGKQLTTASPVAQQAE